MVVNPISYSASVNPVVSNSINAINNFNAFDQLLALQAENAVLATTNQNNAAANTNANDNFILTTTELLNLSPSTLDILNGVDVATQTTTSTNSSSPTDQQVLTPMQQQEAASIVAEYADQPFTSQTYAEIESALLVAGINPQQVSIQQLFNAYAYGYQPGLAFNEQFITDILSTDLIDA